MSNDKQKEQGAIMATRRNTFWAVSMGVALLTCVSCGTGTQTDRMEVRFLSINGVSVHDSMSVAAEGDRDDQTPGVQVNLLVQVDGLAGESSVWLQVGEQQVEAVASSEGAVAFANVTLLPGPNLIEVGCDRCQTAQLDAEVLAPALDISEIVATTVTTFTHDTDSLAPGIQAQFLLRASQVPDGGEIRVTIGESAYQVTVENKRALLAVNLPQGSFVDPVYAEATVGDGIISASGTLVVQGAPCEIVSMGGVDTEEWIEDGQELWFGMAQDQSEAEGLQSSFVIHVGGLPGTAVELLVDGEVLVEAEQDEAGMVSFPEVSLDGDTTLQTRCRLVGAPDIMGKSYDAYVDLAPPTAVNDLVCTHENLGYLCRWTSPVDPGRSGAVSTLELRYAPGDGLGSETYASATPLPSMPYSSQPGQQDQVAFQMDDSPNGVVSFALVSWDRAGNRSSLSNIVTLSAP